MKAYLTTAARRLTAANISPGRWLVEGHELRRDPKKVWPTIWWVYADGEVISPSLPSLNAARNWLADHLKQQKEASS